MKTNKIWEFVGYLTLAGLIIGQITIGFDFWIGQIAYLVSDVIILIPRLRRRRGRALSEGVL